MLKYLLLSLFLISSSISLGQSEGYKNILNSDKTFSKKVQAIDSLLENYLIKKKYDKFQVDCNSYSSWLYNNNNASLSRDALLLSLKYVEEQDSTLLSKRYRKLEHIERRSGRFLEAIVSGKRAIKFGLSGTHLFKAYANLGDCYFELSDFELSKKYYDLATEGQLKEKKFSDYITTTSLSFNTYSKIKRPEAYQKIERNLLIADSLSKLTQISIKKSFTLKSALALLYSNYETYNLSKGSKYALECIEIAHIIKDSSIISLAYRQYGLALSPSNPLLSLSYFDISLNYLSQNQNISAKSDVLANIGFNQAKIKKYDISLDSQYNALSFALNTTINDDNIPLDLIENNSLNENLRIILSNLAETYYLIFKENGDQDHLIKSVKFFKYSDHLIDTYFDSDVSASAKLLWRKNASLMYSRAIRSCYEARDIETAFLFMEKSKALLLYDELSNLRRLQSLKIPDSLLSKERKLRNNINRLEKLRFKNADSLKTTIAYQDSLNNITKTIIKEFSNYKEIDTNFSYSPISEIQEKLTSDQAILEYHISADNGFGLAPNTDTGYGLFITKDRSLLFEINDLPEIKTLSNDLLSKIRTKQRNSSENQEFIKSSRHLYNKLIPEQIRENLKNKKITIIPDNYLSELPFEALVINKAEDPLTYFIETNEIHYLYSLSFQELNEKGMSTLSRKHKISAFAPVSFTALPSLDNTDREVKRIQDHLNGTIFLGESASKANFISILKDSEIIHLATHAKATDDNPWIEFFDERIYLNELNTLSNNASLVVLSACETTTGEIADGEGVLSLARGFFYGGAQATVSSLWQVDDKSTYFIMDQFYKNLSEGSTKSSSLRNAKLTYINNHSGSELSPYYWSSFILTGSIDPISQEKYYWVYALTIGLGVLIVLFTLSRKRK